MLGGEKNLKICSAKLDVCLARQCKSPRDIRDAASQTTLQRIRNGREVTPKTAGRIARALGVDIAEILESGGKETANG